MPGGSELDQKVSEQSEQAIRRADVVMFVVDATVGVTDEDAEVAELLRRIDRAGLRGRQQGRRHPARGGDLGPDVARSGRADPVSALHGRGTGDLLDLVVSLLPEPTTRSRRGARGRRRRAVTRSMFSSPLVGRPNVGKSTLFNRLIGEDRSVVHDMPGTTRDSIDTVVETEHGPIRFIDTAGMRRKSRVDEGTEYFSMVRALDVAGVHLHGAVGDGRLDGRPAVVQLAQQRERGARAALVVGGGGR